jgi:hypothetical protein
MFHVVTSFNTEWHAADGIQAYKAAKNAYAPLISCAFMFKPCLLFFLCLAIRTLEHHWLSLPIEARDTNKLALLLCNQKL